MRFLTTPKRRLTGVIAVAAISIAAIGCTDAADRTPTTEASGANNTQLSSSIIPVSSGNGASSGQSLGAPAIGSEASTVRFDQGFTSVSGMPSFVTDGSGQTGIWVTGTSTVEVDSDVALVSIGVESHEETVTAARQAAAEAMQKVVDAIKALGVDEDDIVTTSFNIYPQTTWIEVRDSIGTHGEPRIIGYVVSNTVNVKVRDLDKLSPVVDTAAEQGGDLIRIHSISFTVDDPSAHGVAMRESAAKDARAKAELYAKAMGVNLGPLMFLSETSSSVPYPKDYPVMARAEAGDAAFAPTPVSPGDVTLSTTIQAAFAIVP